MARQTWKPGTLVYPVPAVLVTCKDGERENVLTVAWTGTICSDPAMTYISVRKERYSHDIIENSKEFVINLTTEKLAFATDWCGVKSGKDFDKFEKMDLTKQKANFVKCPMIEESPVSIECKVKEIKRLGSHDMFIAEVLGINADEKYFNKTGGFEIAKCNLIAYANGGYYSLGKKVGKFGFSVQKKKKKK